MSSQAGRAAVAPDRPRIPRDSGRRPFGDGWRRTLHVWCAGALSLLLLACSPAPHPPLLVGLNAWVGYDPLVLARDQRLLDDRQVKVVELPSSSETLRHFRNGLLDAAALTLDETLRLADEGIELRVVAVLDASHGADVVLVHPRIRALADLRGASIAVESSTVGALMLQGLLQAAGLTRTDLQVVHLEATRHLAALNSGRVSAAVSYEPVAGGLRAAGFTPIFDSRQMPGDILDVLVVRADLLQTRPAQVDALLAAWQAGLQALRADPAAAARQLAPGTDLTPHEYLASFGSLTFYDSGQSLGLLTGAPAPLEQNALRLVATLKAMDLLKDKPDWGQLLAPGPSLRMQALKEAP